MRDDVERRFRPGPRQLIAAMTGILSVGGALAIAAISGAGLDGGVAVPSPSSWSWWCAAAVLVAQACVLWWSGRAPRTALVAVTTLPVVLAVIAPGALFSLTALAVMVAVFLTVLALPDRRVGTVIAIAYVLVAGGYLGNELRVGELEPLLASGASVAQACIVVGIPALVGLMVAARRDAHAARVGEAAALERERDMLVRAAAARERVAMSRELHDIAAHHMSGIALMASAIDRQIDTDPAAARHSAAQIREQSRTVLDDLRRVVGLLRDDSAAARSVQSISAVRHLVDARREAGARVELVTHPADHGRPLGDGVGALAQVAIYSMVQESLTNAATHAGDVLCRVTIDDRGDRLVVVVSNNTPTTAEGGQRGRGGRGGGFGLLGMRERAEMIGGELEYGPTPHGGWAVRLSVGRGPATEAGLPQATGAGA